MARVDLAREIVGLMGADVAAVAHLNGGWPSIVEIETVTGRIPVALHVSNVSPHARRPYEWRFQNPGSRIPVENPGQSLPILAGLDHVGDVPVLVAIDGASRVGRPARFSILFNRRICVEAAATGWSEYTSTSGEKIFALRPPLFPVLVEMLGSGLEIPPARIVSAVESSGLLENDDGGAGERARRTASSYVRDARFSRDVRAAYENRCALCGIALNLVVGAHIYPVGAPGAPDRVWNGLALCHNHHSAFDAFQIWVDSNYDVLVRPAFVASAQGNRASVQFLAQTPPRLWIPTNAAHRASKSNARGTLCLLW
jgi:hypothetical protein